MRPFGTRYLLSYLMFGLVIAGCTDLAPSNAHAPDVTGGGTDSGTAPSPEAGGDPKAEQPPPSQPTFTALDAYFDAELRAGLHGVAMQVFDASDKLVYQRESGVCATKGMCPAGNPPFTVDLVTGIASSSKWVTSTTVLAVLDDLVAAGKRPSMDAALDTPVVPILSCPGISGPVTQITIRHLLSFTSGLIPEAECVKDPTMTLRDCACEILGDSARAMVDGPSEGTPQGSAHRPGTTYKYGNAHHVVAGAVVQAVTRKEWSAVFEEKILAPTGAKMTYQNPKNLAGSIQASVRDYAKLVGALFHDVRGDGKRILSSAAAKAQRDNQMPANVVRLRIPQEGTDYGLNVWRWCYASFDESVLTDPKKLIQRSECDQVFQMGHGGKGGYQPFLDVGGGYYAVMATREPSEGDGADYTDDEVSLSLGVRLRTHLAMSRKP